MKIMTRKVSACLMPLLLFFYLAMSPVALANDAGTDVNVIAPADDTFLNIIENRSIVARRGYRQPRYQRQPTSPKKNWQSIPSEERSDSEKKQIEWNLNNDRRQGCPAKAEKHCQLKYENDLQSSIKICRRSFLITCQQKIRKYTPRDSEETIKNWNPRKDFNRQRRLRRQYVYPE